MIVIDFSKFTKMLEGIISDLKPTVEDALDTLAEIAVTNAKSSTLFKNQTGTLRREIAFRKNGSFIRDVISPTPYAKYVEFGNRPNGTGDRIYPKKAGALRFVINGQTLFRNRVRSHGPLPYMGSAHKFTQSFLPNLVRNKFERLVQKHVTS